jgi:hypothetical protein
VACLPSADHEHADHEDGDQREHRRDHTGADVHERTGGVPEVRDQLLGDVLELRGDVVLLVRLLELWILVERLVEVLGIAGQLVGQVDTLLDGGRNQDQRDACATAGSGTGRGDGYEGAQLAGRPVIYTTFLAYDEVAHHSGIERRDALAVLTHVDRQLARVETALREPLPTDWSCSPTTDSHRAPPSSSATA